VHDKWSTLDGLMKLTTYLGRIIVLSVSNELGVIVVVWKDSKIVELDINNEVSPALKWGHGRGPGRHLR
jgi:hypothetical protein